MLALALLALVAPFAALYAQPAARPVSQVPIEIVTGALAPLAGYIGKHDFTIGHAPASWPADLLPDAPATVIGGVSASTHTMLTFSEPADIASALARYRAVLARAGWRPAARQPSRGFQPVSPRPGTGAFCHGREALSIDVGDSSATRTVINVYRLAITGGTYSPLCDTTDHTVTVRMGPQPSTGDSIPMPTLTPPAGVTQSHGSLTVSTNREATAHARVQSTIPARTLADHYLGQLAALGWTQAKAEGTDAWAAATVEKTEGADRWRIVLLLTDEGDWRDLMIRLRRAPAR
jgi:hypothetical protein